MAILALNMTLDEIKQILDLVREHDLSEFELEQEGVKLRVRKRGAEAPTKLVSAAPPPASPGAVPAAAPAAAAATGAIDAGGDADGVELAMEKSPIVGTFYRTPEPSSPPFVNIGDTVRKNQVLCIIEAMKLMNEIVSEYDGELVEVFVESGQPVQYGERLFAIKAS
jgi:acetyl-CoA carboxylase biotin carboxyl carrier protein